MMANGLLQRMPTGLGNELPYGFGQQSSMPAQVSQAQPSTQAPSEPQGFRQRARGILGSIGGFFQNNPNLLDTLAIGFGGMSMNPNEALMQQAAGRIQQRQAMQMAQSNKNRTIEMLRSMGMNREADMLQNADPSMVATLAAEFLSREASTDNYKILSGADLNTLYPGANYPEGSLFKLETDSGNLTAVQGAERPTADIENYNYYRDQMELMGQTPVTFDEFRRTPQASPTRIREYEYARNEGGYTGSFQDFLRLTAQERPLTQDEANSLGYYNRAADVNMQLAQMIDIDGAQMPLEMAGTIYEESMAGSLPFGVGAYFQSPAYQMFDQAKRNFVNAVLRKESGAAISASEFENAEQQYFPVPGDTPERIEFKRQNRERAVQNLAVSAGRALERNPRTELSQTPQSGIAPSASINGKIVTVYNNGIPSAYSFENEQDAQNFLNRFNEQYGRSNN